MSYDLNIREEELKNKVAQDYFWIYDNTKIIGDVDFCVAMHKSEKELFEQESLLWAEAKKGIQDIYKSFVQLILTIGKARTFDKYLPPVMLAAFDAEKIAFIPYNDIHDIFYLNDFNWNVTPSNHETKEFELIHNKVKSILDQNTLIFNYSNDDKELKGFIRENFIVGKWGLTKTRIDKNNFIVIYNKWLDAVKPTIAVNWDIAKKKGVIDGDFYLADLLSSENITLKDKLFVVLKATKYKLNRHMDEYGAFTSSSVEFSDGQKAHTQFWNKYERPPKEEYWDYIVERRDLLVPQDVRERKGSFFTPQIWVIKSQEYLADVLGKDWQDEYYVWDCAAGTGNLLTGLTKKYNIWASTLDKQDVDVMKTRIKNGANLLEDHVFQFDFLNDDFSNLPKPLQDIINDPEKRKKLIVYINPPYAEVSSVREKGKAGVNKSKTHDKYSDRLGTAGREIYIMFLARIFAEIKGCILAEFSKLKALQGSAFDKFRAFFKASLVKSFIVPANTFDNVKGRFPIGFKIWNTEKSEIFREAVTDIYDEDGIFLGSKTLYVVDKKYFINNWITKFKVKENYIGFLAGTNGNDFQQNGIVYVINKKEQMANPRGMWISKDNLIQISIYFAVRKSIASTWMNDRDQFIHPNSSWLTDIEFQNDCLTFALFRNNIKSEFGTNHWIPFSESEVNAREKFESDFMYRFIKGKIKPEEENLFTVNEPRVHYEVPLKFSPEATKVFNVGRELWKYYHAQPKCNVNASLYDIRAHFQGRSAKGRMNSKSDDETYMKLINELRGKLKLLAQKIEPKVYEYGFLKQ
ncbi:MAG: hypothetical protein U9N85_10855 [Bacteroidota bacterium]|nr:hypothetical protein [Bacteroidota bacterium]